MSGYRVDSIKEANIFAEVWAHIHWSDNHPSIHFVENSNICITKNAIGYSCVLSNINYVNVSRTGSVKVSYLNLTNTASLSCHIVTTIILIVHIKTQNADRKCQTERSRHNTTNTTTTTPPPPPPTPHHHHPTPTPTPTPLSHPHPHLINTITLSKRIF